MQLSSFVYGPSMARNQYWCNDGDSDVFSADRNTVAVNADAIGLSALLHLLGTPDDAEVIVAEIGTNSPGEIAQLGAIVEPDAAVG